MLIQLIVIQILTFLGLIFGLKFLFSRHLNSAIKRLNELQEEALVKEAEVRKELERAQEERAAEVEKGKEEARRIVEEAKKEAEGLRLKIETDAKSESNKIVEFGQGELEKLKENLLQNVNEQALNLAIELINYAFTQKGKVDLQHELMQELISEIGSLAKEKFSITPTSKFKIISSVKLSSEEKKHVENILSEKVGRQVSLEEEIDPGLITGFIIQIDELVIDGSLKNKLNKLIPYLKNK
ncbi:MAG: F0F1 ATP synthase subunit delta [Candidatus Omnitrophica bacterium]|nr:F0F1 ATP synthase subunit delta [Candidatus Omnitrophota bacterium]